jgi:hypothetical protein
VWFARHLILDSAGVHPLYATLSNTSVAQLIDTTVVIIPFGLLEQRNAIVPMKGKARDLLES